MIRRMLSPVMMMITMMVVMVMATNSVNMERTGQQKMADDSGKARMVELDQTWPLSDEFKAILGNFDCLPITLAYVGHLRGRAGVLGRSGLHGHRVPAGGAHPAILLQAKAGQGGSRSSVFQQSPHQSLQSDNLFMALDNQNPS